MTEDEMPYWVIVDRIETLLRQLEVSLHGSLDGSVIIVNEDGEAIAQL